ncbi:MAG TPA: adenylate/guanylate cyclase domain-containing protein [Paraburkholderia sp.]|uniref:adenylate/guanylate cyclase domain-containing protein n=1 Tax=Paraburkholderia sp. TaxID=1926495 RepID=UPI002CAA0E75|nr:adenylate/guanylate cyclase domain-containing protein [Paraburkholderia sp.]HTR09026.1 adenylate/guanylate cyclase domain-containing protein [Paraburkholderia sp.]
MRCTNCGFECREGARFCEQCGTVVAHTRSTPSPIDYTPSHLAEQILAAQAALEARGKAVSERKTITALFADMAGSTALIYRLDPEDAHRLIAPVLELMMEAVHHYEGFVAKLLGDGILALFGAPIAHEDHPQRALYAALRMQQAMRRHSDRVRLERGIPLQIRVGVHTGEVVMRAIYKNDLQTDYDPVGNTIHIASRMEAIATPASILVSQSTYRLTEGYFEFKALGQAQVKGIAESLAVYEVHGPGALRTRLQVAEQRGLVRFVGRHAELETLRGALASTSGGQGCVVGVIGEAGVGKSRLFHEFKNSTLRGCLVVETFSVSHGKSFALLPLIELLKNYFQISSEDDERRCREKVTGRVLALERDLEDGVPYLLHLLAIGEPSPDLAQMDSQIRRDRTFEAITRLFVRESVNEPVVLVFEDLQWLDSETQAFLSYLVDCVSSARILLLLNYRPEYQHDWGDHTGYTRLVLEPLGRADAQGLISALVGDDRTLVAVKQHVLDKTEGNPFFIEEVVRTLVEERVLVGEPGHYRMESIPVALHIPTTVQGVLAARIDRLPAAEKDLLQTLAVIGKTFPANLVQGVVDLPNDELYALLSHLVAGEFVYELPAFPSVEYVFKHALTQEVAGNSMLAERRRSLHERIGQAIETLFNSRLKDYWNELAHHYSLSGNVPKAVEYLQSAGQQAWQRSANSEAIRQLGMALDLLGGLPETPERAERELALRLAIGPALMAARGWASPEVEATYTRALELCRQAGQTPHLFRAQTGLRMFYQLRAEYKTAKEIAERLLEEAERAHNPTQVMEAHYLLGMSAFRLGELACAHAYLAGLGKLLLRQDAAQFDEEIVAHGRDPRSVGGSLGLVLWHMGFPDEALRHAELALTRDRSKHELVSLAQTLLFKAELHQLRREAALTRDCAEAAITLATEQGFPMILAWATMLHGWALAEAGEKEEGIARVRQGLADYEATGARLGRSYFLALLSETYGRAGQREAGLDALAEAMAACKASDERFHEPELYRLRGELQLLPAGFPAVAAADRDAAQQNFNEAIAIAHRRGARSLELRAALSLAGRYMEQGKTSAARQILAPVYEAFTEGFGTADLQQAKARLDELAAMGM